MNIFEQNINEIALYFPDQLTSIADQARGMCAALAWFERNHPEQGGVTTAGAAAREGEPGAITLASVLPADAASIHSTLRALTGVDDPYLCLFLVGAYKSGIDTTSLVYDVYWASAVILTEDGSAQAEANQKFTGNLALQPSGIPTETIATNAHTLTWNTSTGAVTFAPPAPGTNPS